jgi:hypothetical protein
MGLHCTGQQKSEPTFGTHPTPPAPTWKPTFQWSLVNFPLIVRPEAFNG